MFSYHRYSCDIITQKFSFLIKILKKYAMVKTIPQKNNKRYFSDILLSKTMDDSVAGIIYWYYYAIENSCSRIKGNG